MSGDLSLIVIRPKMVWNFSRRAQIKAAPQA
jgi:hypothetical protein